MNKENLYDILEDCYNAGKNYQMYSETDIIKNYLQSKLEEILMMKKQEEIRK